MYYKLTKEKKERQKSLDFFCKIPGKYTWTASPSQVGQQNR